MAPAQRNNFLIILILGALSTVTPFSIDMYLPAFAQIGADFGVPIARISLSVSSYFIGLAFGQIFYGPLLDRFGRKNPLYIGLGIFMVASIGCIFSKNIETLIVFRFLQAIGGCSAQVASMTMVRDFFPVNESAKVFSLLMLILGVSPLLAPTIGGFIAVTLGWHAVFIILDIIVCIILALSFFYLPAGHALDPTVSLRPKPILATFGKILKTPQFYTYALAGAFSFAGLFVYVAGSPIIFMDGFHVSPQLYSGIFAMLAVGFIGGSQLNLWLTKKFRNDQVFRTALICQVIVALVFLIGTLNNWYGLVSTIGLWFLILSCTGLTYPNAAALALAPFGENAGSASALIGFLQMGTGALASIGVGLFEAHSSVPAISVLAATTLVSLAIFLWGKRNLIAAISVGEPELFADLH